jgi:hypothetical protein
MKTPCSNWQPMDTAPGGDDPILAYGYSIEEYSGLREELATKLICLDWKNSWTISSSGQLFEPLGWAVVPALPKLEIVQPKPIGVSPKFSVGQQVGIDNRYDGIAVVTITAVIAWPSGWWYALNRIDNPGKGNPTIGHSRLHREHWGECAVIGRPAMESELIDLGAA